MNDVYLAFKESRGSEYHLEHYGVKGQKWGVRRYQDYDGTRIGVSPRVMNKLKVWNKDKKDDSVKEEKPKHEKQHGKYRDSADELSDEELSARIRRMENEIKYKKQQEILYPDRSKARKEAIKKIFVDSAITAASTLMNSVYSEIGKRALEGIGFYKSNKQQNQGQQNQSQQSSPKQKSGNNQNESKPEEHKKTKSEKLQDKLDKQNAKEEEDHKVQELKAQILEKQKARTQEVLNSDANRKAMAEIAEESKRREAARESESQLRQQGRDAVRTLGQNFINSIRDNRDAREAEAKRRRASREEFNKIQNDFSSQLDSAREAYKQSVAAENARRRSEEESRREPVRQMYNEFSNTIQKIHNEDRERTRRQEQMTRDLSRRQAIRDNQDFMKEIEELIKKSKKR